MLVEGNGEVLVKGGTNIQLCRMTMFWRPNVQHGDYR